MLSRPIRRASRTWRCATCGAYWRAWRRSPTRTAWRSALTSSASQPSGCHVPGEWWAPLPAVCIALRASMRERVMRGTAWCGGWCISGRAARECCRLEPPPFSCPRPLAPAPAMQSNATQVGEQQQRAAADAGVGGPHPRGRLLPSRPCRRSHRSRGGWQQCCPWACRWYCQPGGYCMPYHVPPGALR